MKKQILISIILATMFLPLSMIGQDGFTKLYDKYAGQDGFTSINIAPEMFSFFSALDVSDSSEEVQQSQNVIQQLDGLMMLVYEKPEDGKGLDFYSILKKEINIKKYTELMSVIDDDGSNVKFLAKKTKDNMLSELLMIIASDDEVVLMSMTGNIDMNTVSQLSNSFNMKGMDKLEKLEEK